MAAAPVTVPSPSPSWASLVMAVLPPVMAPAPVVPGFCGSWPAAEGRDGIETAPRPVELIWPIPGEASRLVPVPTAAWVPGSAVIAWSPGGVAGAWSSVMVGPWPSVPPGWVVAGWVVAGWVVAGWVVAGWVVAGWVVAGWVVAGWVVAGWVVAGWVVAGWVVAGWVVAGWVVAGWVVAGWVVAGWVVAGWVVAGWVVPGWVVPGCWAGWRPGAGGCSGSVTGVAAGTGGFWGWLRRPGALVWM